MDPHFRAFTFVDRIHSIETSGRITGQYSIPAHLDSFPNSLVAEAVGQLAAWSAMSMLDFAFRPVAGLAGRVDLISAVEPGQILELTADVDSVDAEAVSYGGTAAVHGRPILELQHCVGPMMPLKDFDDPEQLRQRFELLRDEPAPFGLFHGVQEFDLPLQALTPENSLRATLQVPREAEFFADHFPRKPVFPGTLLTHSNLRLAAALMEQADPSPAGGAWLPRSISDVKLRAFIAPGETLELEARIKEATQDKANVAMQTRSGGKRLGSCRVELGVEPSQ
jgi:3-hydroxymyristoyl/3-hydroxydecanoyl-(acyl carrier protein) dehydratase